MSRTPPRATFVGRCSIVTSPGPGGRVTASVLGAPTRDLFGVLTLPEWARVTRPTRSAAVAAARREARALPCGK